jgi:hypothetical protein
MTNQRPDPSLSLICLHSALLALLDVRDTSLMPQEAEDAITLVLTEWNAAFPTFPIHGI